MPEIFQAGPGKMTHSQETQNCFSKLRIFKPEDHWSFIAHLNAEDMLGNTLALNAV